MHKLRPLHARIRKEKGRVADPNEVRSLVLVVEDEPVIQSLLAEHLTAAGFDVCVAPDGEVALELVRKRRPAVVCLDLNLPRISGYDVCEEIRADPTTRDVSILIMSARHSLDVRAFALEAGADAYLTKPYAMEQLTDEVERLCALRTRGIAEKSNDGSRPGEQADDTQRSRSKDQPPLPHTGHANHRLVER